MQNPNYNRNPDSDPCKGNFAYRASDSVAPFEKKNDKVRVSIGRNLNRMRLVTSVLDTGSVPYLIYSRLIQSDWNAKIMVVKDRYLNIAGRKSIAVIGFILLHVRMGDLKVHACFGIA